MLRNGQISMKNATFEHSFHGEKLTNTDFHKDRLVDRIIDLSILENMISAPRNVAVEITKATNRQRDILIFNTTISGVKTAYTSTSRTGLPAVLVDNGYNTNIS